jgi:hypothetical protein
MTKKTQAAHVRPVNTNDGAFAECKSIGARLHDATQKLMVLEAAIDNCADRLPETMCAHNEKEAQEIVSAANEVRETLIGVLEELRAVRYGIYDVNLSSLSRVMSALEAVDGASQ